MNEPNEIPGMDDLELDLLWNEIATIKRQQLPTSLFKFRAMSPDSTRRNSIEALKDDYVWAGRADTMNDDRDSTSDFDMLHRYLEATAKAEVRRWSNDERIANL